MTYIKQIVPDPATLQRLDKFKDKNKSYLMIAALIFVAILALLIGIAYLLPSFIFFIIPSVIALLVIFAQAVYNLITYKNFLKREYELALIDTRLFRNDGEREIYEMVENLANCMGMKMPEVGIYRDGNTNAFAYSLPNDAGIIALSDSMVNPMLYNDTEFIIPEEGRMTPDEIGAVIAHELAHIRSGDSVATTILDIMGKTIQAFVVVPWLWVIGIATFVVAFGRNISIMGLPFIIMGGIFWLLVLPIYVIGQALYVIISQLIQCSFSRGREYQADAAAAVIVGQDLMADALAKIYKADCRVPKDFALAVRSIHNPHRFTGESKVNGFIANIIPKAYMTHPPILDRIDALKEGRYIPE